ncbi:LysE family translocator [Actinopolymorpha sp. B9G3]|uniref:LysE family translocator n=1 Tax=Actinopolymorpha sp. B9G3 TaxID=3158970 RepID=UPI0032D977B2
MNHALLIGFVVAVALVSLVPGPDMLFIVANAITGGRRAGVVAALGMSTGLACHTVAAALGLGALMQAAPTLLEGVRIAGAVFLVYLAVTTWRSSRTRQAMTVERLERPRSVSRVYAMAVLTNLANPKVILFYLAFFPQFLTTGAGSWPATMQFLVLGGTFIVVGLAVDASAGVAAGALSEQVLRRIGVRRWLDRASAAIFGGLAVRLALDSR